MPILSDTAGGGTGGWRCYAAQTREVVFAPGTSEAEIAAVEAQMREELVGQEVTIRRDGLRLFGRAVIDSSD